VKELGKEVAIVFYEGMRPIRCQKIRYFSDRRFRERLVPPPAVPVPRQSAQAVMAHPIQEPQGEPAKEVSGDERPGVMEPPWKEEPVIRDGTVNDIERIESLTLEDFATDFSKLPLPDKEGPLSDGEIKIAADAFLKTLEPERM